MEELNFNLLLEDELIKYVEKLTALEFKHKKIDKHYIYYYFELMDLRLLRITIEYLQRIKSDYCKLSVYDDPTVERGDFKPRICIKIRNGCDSNNKISLFQVIGSLVEDL